MMPLSLGKYHRLQQCSTRRRALAVLAIDHYRYLKNYICPSDPATVTDVELAGFVELVTRHVAPSASAVLLDPPLGAPHCIASGSLRSSIGLLTGVEAMTYGQDAKRRNAVLPGWNIAKAARMGADAVKFLVYYHPDASDAGEIEALVDQVAEECNRYDIPLFLEPLSYPLEPEQAALPPEERRRVVIESAIRLTRRGVDVLKAEFPLDVSACPDERDWSAACKELTEASQVPWVLLSASADYDTYLRQVEVACRAGASGVAVGRAVWKEAAGLHGEARTAFIPTVIQRMDRITALCEALARPWTDVYEVPHLELDWYLEQ